MNLLRRSQIVGAMRHDGYENTLSGLAGNRMSSNRFSKPASLSEGELKSLYDWNWLARRGVDLLVDQAMRKPLVGDKNAFANFDRVNNDERFSGGVFRHGLKMGRLNGGAAIVLGVKGSGTPLEKEIPLDKDGVPVAGDVAFLDVVTRFQLESVERYDTPDDPTKHKRTAVWKVKEGRLAGLKIHESRLVLCGGLTKVDLTDSQEDRDWPWISVLQPVNEILGNYGISWTAISHLIQEASIAYMKLRGLTDMLTTEDKKVVDERMNLLSTGRNVAKTVFLEAGDNGEQGEEYGRTEVSFAGVPDVIRECTLTVCGALRIPYIILMGDTPAGLNATGDSTLQQWYDTADEYRTSDCEPKLKRLFKSTKVTVDWKWPTLWEPTAAQAAQLRAQNAAADTQYWQMGVLQPKHILVSRLNDGTLGIIVDPKEALADLEAAEAEEEAQRKEMLAATARNPIDGSAPPDDGQNENGGRQGNAPPKKPDGGTGRRDEFDPNQPRDELGRWMATVKSEIGTFRAAAQANLTRAQNYAASLPAAVENRLRELGDQRSRIKSPSPEADFEGFTSAQRELTRIDRLAESIRDVKSFVKELKSEAKTNAAALRGLDRVERLIEARKFEKAGVVLERLERGYEFGDAFETDVLGWPEAKGEAAFFPSGESYSAPELLYKLQDAFDEAEAAR